MDIASVSCYLSHSLSLHAISVPTVPASPQYTSDTLIPPDTPMPPNSPLHPLEAPMPPDAHIPLLVPEYLESLLAPQYTPNTPYTP